MINKIFDCVTFFQENLLTNIRFEILNEVVDYFVICESKYDHRGNKKDLNFNLIDSKFKKKVIYIALEQPFKKKNNLWENQAEQREFIFKGLQKAKPDDYIMFSDPDEIPRPELLKEFSLKKKYGIFLQNIFCYKFNLFNEHESPWEGTRISQKKNLKSIDYMRQKIKIKNLNAPFWKFNKERSIEIIKNGGWHFNSLLEPKEISIKLKTFAHKEFSCLEFSDINIIKKNISEMRDLFKRDRYYKKIKLDKTFPDYILQNQDKLKKWILF